MSLHRVCLQEFIQPTANCSGSMPFKAVFEIFDSSDRLVIVDEQQHPLGVLWLYRLLPHVLNVYASEAGVGSVAQKLALLAHLPEDLTIAKVLEHPSGTALLEPVVVLSDRLNLQTLLPDLNHHQHTYALIDAAGKFLGLLDCDRLLRLLAKTLAEAPDSFTLAQTEPTWVPSGNAQPQPEVVQLTQQLLAQRAELEQRIKAQQAEIVHLKQQATPPAPINVLSLLSIPNVSAASLARPALLNSLLQLLERLPLPLMLQTSSGQILAQNSVWQTQVGELADPTNLWREAAIWLKDIPYSTSDAPEANHSTYSHHFSQPIDLEQSLCQLGANSDTCVCVCPLKDGQEQVLQFVKIPLGTLLPDLKLNWAKPSESRQRLDEVSAPNAALITSETDAAPFQLATLTATPLKDPFTQVERSAPFGTRLASDSDPANEPLWLVLAQDVTKQQHLAKELTAKNADLVQLNRLKDEFLACISHELKTPLTAVLGLSSLLKDQTLGELNPRQVHYAQLIHQSSRHLMGVVNDILDLTRIETGQLELMYEPVDVATVCNRAFKQAKQAHLTDSKTEDDLEEELTAQFSFEVETGLDVLLVDALRLRQMLVHLLANSLKFTEAGKPIGLKVTHWGGWIAFTVWDTGIGIPAEKQHLIFQKFQQLENPLTRQFEGAGLGLVLTRRLAQLHGGDVTFISQEGQGSQFTILLPPSPPDQAQLSWKEELTTSEAAIAFREPYPGERVSLRTQQPNATASGNSLPPIQRSRLMLLVDAVPQCVESLTDKLTGFGYQAINARSGTEALEKARRIQPSVIFLNPLLPLLSGWDVLTLLKSNAETQHIPVVITAPSSDEEQAYRQQANGFLKLPIHTKELQRTLEQVYLSGASCDTTADSLTVLRLFASDASSHDSPIAPHLEQLLQSQRYRILESDDLDQAELLARVWHPNVVLLDGAFADASTYMEQLSRRSSLASLPLVMLTEEITHAANQIPGLTVFPCLSRLEDREAVAMAEFATLLQVIQVAAGCARRSTVLAVDVSSLPMSAEGQPPEQTVEELSGFPRETEWLQALTQYLQTAGLRSLIGRSWQEVMQQVESQSIDVLLLCWTHGEPQPAVMAMLAKLHNLKSKLPIIVLDHRDPELGETTLIPLPSQVRQLATEILSPPVSMTELLKQVHRAIAREASSNGIVL